MTDAARTATVVRTTKETDVRVELSLDGSGTASADTGLPFFDHMLQQLGTHAGWDLQVTSKGDLEVDGHHTVEDVGIAVGQALAEALGDKAGIRRFASITVPLDEAAVEVALDLSGRAFVVHEVEIPAEMIGTFDTGLVEDFVRAFATTAQMYDPRPPEVGALAAPRRGGGVQGDGQGARRRVRPDRSRHHAEHEGNAVSGATRPIAVLDYGMGNLHSVSRALAKVGGNAEVTREPAAVGEAADALVIPGVGAFGACVRALTERGLDRAIRDFVGHRTAGVRRVPGHAGVVQGKRRGPRRRTVDRLRPVEEAARRTSRCRTWDGTPSRGSGEHPYIDGIPSGTRFYFVHSYAPDVIEGTTVGVTEHGRPFSSVVASDNVFATQFHPEKSADAGLQIYESFVKAVSEA